MVCKNLALLIEKKQIKNGIGSVEGFSQAVKGIISSAADVAARAAEKVISPTADFHHDVIILPDVGLFVAFLIFFRLLLFS